MRSDFSSSKVGVLLINLGTPKDCDPKSVKRYLREFLNDPRVIDLPAWIRWPLVNGLIIPLRYLKTARAYQKIWQQGSPLMLHTQALTQEVATALGDAYQIEMGMRYGQPSIPSALEKLKQCGSIIVIPLFPQYSAAATGSAVQEVLKFVMPRWNIPALNIKRDFYNDPYFIDAYAQLLKSHLDHQLIDKIVFSYHGLPERHLAKSGCRATSDSFECACVREDNQFCYRAQCYETTRLIAEALSLLPQQYTVAFQSRLGRTPWIKPYTDYVLPELIKAGNKHIAIISPSFVADCLETSEEINIRLREQWLSLGGQTFTFVPSLNASPLWVKALVKMITAFPR